MSDKKEYVYSTDKEDYYTKEAFKERIEYLGHEVPVYRGIKIKFTHNDFVWVDEFLEMMERQAEDVCMYEDALYTDFSKEDKDALQKVIVDWLVKHKGQPMIFDIADAPEDENGSEYTRRIKDLGLEG